ncbi:MAG: DUF1926 domain-containing protein, partial [Candidatus Riflebacteria bacterium]|nr:DUF1926 domain-containing protein [Candidatus Riflebacteria bacterium]
AALDLLWKGQCNCAYWHGVYAGLYLPHLREAVYSNLIRAEAELDRGREPGWTYLEMVDLDCDGTPEVIASSAALNAFFSLVGGAMFELDFKPRAANLADTLARWPEAYHPKDGEEYDGYPRDSFLDHFYAPGTSLVQALDSGDFAQGLYEHHPVPAAQRTAFKLVRHGAIAHGESTHPVTVEKEFEIDREACRITARYRVTNTGPVQLATRFGVELNWALQSGDAPSDRFVLVDGQTPVERRLGARAEHPGARELVAHDRWRKLAMKMQWSRPAVLWRYPVETTSRTFARTETIFQSLCLIPVWDLELPIGGTFAVDLVLTVEATS